MTFSNSPDHSWVVVSTGQVRDVAGQRCRTNFGNIENNLFLEIPSVTFYGIVMESCTGSFVMILTKGISKEKSYFRSTGQSMPKSPICPVSCPVYRKYDFS